jgi:hypothetical protein
MDIVDADGQRIGLCNDELDQLDFIAGLIAISSPVQTFASLCHRRQDRLAREDLRSKILRQGDGHAEDRPTQQ